MDCRTSSMEQEAIAAECSDDVSILNRGELIEATGPHGNYYHGEVDEIAPGMGIVWINDRSLGFRKMLDSDDYAIRVIRR